MHVVIILIVWFELKPFRLFSYNHINAPDMFYTSAICNKYLLRDCANSRSGFMISYTYIKFYFKSNFTLYQIVHQNIWHYIVSYSFCSIDICEIKIMF